MANVLKLDKQITVISALAEGSSIRSIERMTGINRNTIMKLGVRIGKGCATLLGAKMRDLTCEQLQFDEVFAWAYDYEDADKPTQHVTVLQIPPATTPENAVRAAIVSEHGKDRIH